MAETKKTTKSTKSSKSTTSSSSSSSSKKSKKGILGWGLNKISFYTIGAVAILYLISVILAACGVHSVVIGVLQGLATAIMISIVAFLAWNYVKSKPVVWKVLYLVFLLVVLLGIIIPLVI